MSTQKSGEQAVTRAAQELRWLADKLETGEVALTSVKHWQPAEKRVGRVEGPDGAVVVEHREGGGPYTLKVTYRDVKGEEDGVVQPA